MSGNWLLVENSRHAAAASHVAEKLPGCRFLSTSPAALASLSERGRDPLCLFRFLPLQELNRVAERNKGVAASICSCLDDELRAAEPGLPPDFKPFDALLFQFKSVLDAVSFRQLELDGFLRSEAPGTLCYWPRPTKSFDRLHEQLPGYSQPFLWSPFESIAAALLEVWVESNARSLRPLGKELLGQNGPETEPRGFSLAETALRAMLNFNRLTGLVSLGYRNLGKGSEARLRVAVLSANDEILAFLRWAASDSSLGVDWWTELARSPVSMRSGWTVRLQRKAPRPAWGSLQSDRIRLVIESAWASSGVDLPKAAEAVLKDRLARYACRRLPQLEDLFQRVSNYLESRQPSALLSGTTVGDSVQVVAQACRREDVPLVCFQHGGNFGYVQVPQLVYSDLKVPDIFCVFSDETRRILEQQRGSPNDRPRVLSIGWARQGGAYLSRMRRKNVAKGLERTGVAGSKPMLIYAPTNLMGDRRFGPNYWHDDTAYYLHQLELIKTLAAHGSFEVMVKLHFKDEADSPISRHLARTGFEGLLVEQTTPLPELIPASDLVVLDWPATSLLEALAQNKPVIYVDLGWLRWEEEPERSLREEVCWIAKSQGWRRKLQEALDDWSSDAATRSPRGFSAAYANAEWRPEALLEELRPERS